MRYMVPFISPMGHATQGHSHQLYMSFHTTIFSSNYIGDPSVNLMSIDFSMLGRFDYK